MSVQELLSEIERLPIIEQKELLDKLSSSLNTQARKQTSALISEEEFLQILLAEGVISEIPPRAFDPEEETFEPVEVVGKPTSEVIIEERR